MTAPSIKEALELKPCPFCGSEITHIESLARSFDPPRMYHEWHHKDDAKDCPIRFRGRIVCSSTDDLQTTKKYRDAWNTRATLQPSGERREAIARLLYRRFVIHPHADFDDLSDRLKTEWLEHADAILASGLVQDEAAIRADEREKCAKVIDVQFQWDDREEIAAAIRSARDGGAET